MTMLVQQRSGGVAELVRRYILRKSCRLNRVFYNDLDSSCGKPDTSIADKKRVIFWMIAITVD